MPRVDIWDVPDAEQAQQPLWCGYRRGLTDKYDLDRQLGEGGFGSVRVVRSKTSGAESACKSICKRLDVPNLPPIKQQQHLENIQREVFILRKLRGTLNVVHLEAVYEDESHVHIVMEYCRGGELFHRMGRRHYSERTVASYMRAVLRTLAQCHHHRILHRDVKPGNFMLLTEAEEAPLKAIDFGLAVFYDPAQLPLTDLGLEGTPWYMSPEVLSSAVEPASDVWAAGVMAYQLLSGRFPFDDWQHPEAPALSLVWRSIISEQPSFSRGGWQDITDSAKDFCRSLLNKDPRQRPSAREALQHPWLRKGNARQRVQGAQLTQVVQRLQRHSQQNVFKKTVLDMMANELLSRHMARMREAEAAAAAAAGPEQQHAAGAANTTQQQRQSPAAADHDVQPSAAARAPAAPGSAATSEQELQQQHCHRLEGTWHGPGGAAVAADAFMERIAALDKSWHGPDSAAQAPGGALAASVASRIASLDRSWHGNTRQLVSKSAAAAAGAARGAAAAAEREEFLRFLEAAKRARQEQRKVARLVLEGSAHGGWLGVRPAGVRLIDYAAAAAAAAGGGDADVADMSTDGDEEEDAAGSRGGSLHGTAESADSGSKGSTPGNSGRGGDAAAAAAADASSSGSGSGRRRVNLLGKFQKGVRSLLSPGSSKGAAVSGSAASGPAGAGGRSKSGGAAAAGLKHVSSLDRLARVSCMPAAPDDAGEEGAGQAQEPAPAAAAAAARGAGSGSAANAGQPGAAAAAAAAEEQGGGTNQNLAEQILELQSPGWQASLESRRRGQGAYAALMAATSMATDGPAAAEFDGAAAAAAAPGADDAAAAAPVQQQGDGAVAAAGGGGGAAAAPAVPGAAAVSSVKPLWAAQQEQQEKQQQQQQQHRGSGRPGSGSSSSSWPRSSSGRRRSTITTSWCSLSPSCPKSRRNQISSSSSSSSWLLSPAGASSSRKACCRSPEGRHSGRRLLQTCCQSLLALHPGPALPALPNSRGVPACTLHARRPQPSHRFLGRSFRLLQLQRLLLCRRLSQQRVAAAVLVSVRLQLQQQAQSLQQPAILQHSSSSSSQAHLQLRRPHLTWQWLLLLPMLPLLLPAGSRASPCRCWRRSSSCWICSSVTAAASC
ncbi:hypothetical protein COO60DRAFT_312479 [Scenedesmus sp. NREL 46B-D3]|nr:hypothetical protein COO60DRAFT_312479 [Scenedesmus sp. NREL 46B-D3]